MSRYLHIVIGLLLLAGFSSCQRVIDVDIKSSSGAIVIEGNLINVTGAQIISVTRSVAYSDANVYPGVSGAVISVSNGATLYTFKETTTPGQYSNSTIKPKPGQSFTLSVTVDNKNYSATSIMPGQVTLDSIGVSDLSVGKKTVKTVSVFYSDPPQTADQYRFVIWVNGVQVKQIFTVNDVLTNGRMVNNTLYQDDISIKAGDKIDVEMQCIDPPVYNYFYSLSQQGGNGPNDSATPSNPISNLSNNALGYFSAHTSQKKSMTVL